VKRGLICWVNLEPASPPESGKVRPAVVISNSDQNEILETVVVVPLSSRPREIWPLRLLLRQPDGKETFAVLPGIRQVDKRRLGSVIGPAPAEFLATLDAAVMAYLTGD
jgi:mRNA interferase MazF